MWNKCGTMKNLNFCCAFIPPVPVSFFMTHSISVGFLFLSFFCLKDDTTIMEYHFHKRVPATMPM